MTKKIGVMIYRGIGVVGIICAAASYYAGDFLAGGEFVIAAACSFLVAAFCPD